MKMTLYFSCNCYVILDAIYTDCPSLAVTCFTFFLMSILFEFLLTYKKIKLEGIRECCNVDLYTRLKVTLLYLLICVILYLNMFGLMTYNMYIIIAVILGNVTGYYLFGISEKSNVRKVNSVGCCYSG